MADVDAAAILYFGTPYRWCEDLYTGWLATIGHPVGQLLQQGVGTPAVASNCSYTAPLGVDDLVRLELRAAEVGRRSFRVRCDVWHDGTGEHSLTVGVSHVWCHFEDSAQGQHLTSARLPDWLRDALTRDAAEPSASAP